MVVIRRLRFDSSLEQIMELVFFLKKLITGEAEVQGFIGSEKVPSS
jgi:hypothetical protein